MDCCLGKGSFLFFDLFRDWEVLFQLCFVCSSGRLLVLLLFVLFFNGFETDDSFCFYLKKKRWLGMD